MTGEHNPLKVVKQPVSPEALEAAALQRYQGWLEGSQKSQVKFLFSEQYQNLIARLNKKKDNPDRLQPFLTPQAAQDYLAFNDTTADFLVLEEERTKKMYEAMFGEKDVAHNREQQEKDLNTVIAKYGDLISRLNSFFLPPANLKNSTTFSRTSIMLRLASDLAEDSQPANENYDDEGQQALEQMAHDAPEKGALLLVKEQLSDLRLTMMNLANFMGRKQALAYFQHSFVYFLKDYLAGFGLNAPASLVLRVSPTVRENYEENKRWVDALPENTNKEEGRQLFQKYIDNLTEQAGPLFNNLSEEKQQAYKADGLAKIVGRISALAQNINFGSEREVSAAKDFLQDFPDVFDFVRLILNINNQIWQQEAKKEK